ncbi:type I-E CRISPR-associated protein Cas7/Cse4/CasC [Methylosoma difficile]
MTNPFKGKIIEFHILQSFPVTCLNRDDVGSPKSAVVGGTTRARVSSQCWKRQVRLAMNAMGVSHGIRTRSVAELIAIACKKLTATDEQAELCGQKIDQIFVGDKKAKANEKTAKKGKNTDETSEAEVGEATADKGNETLIFISPTEVEIIAQAFSEAGFNPELVIKQKDTKKQAKELEDLLGKALIGDNKERKSINAVDIALFGRMVAKAPTMNIEAASSFGHAISTHKVSSEIEFFTAVADPISEDEEPIQGSAHMGSLEFSSATYYRYISLNLGQLYQSLAGQSLPEAVEAFTKALFIAVPNARQTTMSGGSAWEFAKVMVRKGQRLQVPFETAVKAKDGGYLQPSIETLSDYLAKKEKLYGSLFGKHAEYTFGEDEAFSIDDLAAALKSHVEA